MDNTLINKETDCKAAGKRRLDTGKNLLLAQAVYLVSDGNLKKAVMTLKEKHKVTVGLSTLAEWVKKHGWDRNLTSQQFAYFVGTDDLFYELYHVKNEAMKAFDVKKSAHAAMAVTGIYNSLIDVYYKTKRFKLESFEFVIKEFAKWLIANKPEVLPVFEGAFRSSFFIWQKRMVLNKRALDSEPY
ncbi:MAG: hypothetical protein HQK92_06320 [Nitrospirae bacterium]|nr:hypothetical protein [Nitrospirota bacterium]